ncbi:H-NS family nucleoid-associated regulatory protein [Burkholderia ubonensis]|uniref:H-NS histone family protein n=1 Tax=Burkholderia ubonensis TaxID=101571 RepID=UPI0009B39F58|nr:H-NS histone family protein [Burkholderia ubonensis]
MTSYQELRGKLANLTREVEAARLAEYTGVVAQVRQLVSEYGVTAEDVFGVERRDAAKYRDPHTGKTWSGKGRMPLWMKNQDRAKFLIRN